MRTRKKDVKYCGVDAGKIMGANPKLNPEMFDLFVHYFTERHLIYKRKELEGKPRPWTKDPILQQYKFTNVFRENDRVSRQIIQMVSLNDDLTLEDKVANTFLIRSWNNPSTFKDLGGPWTAREIYSPKLKEKVRPLYNRLLQENPERKWWSSAYNQGGTKYAWKFPDGEGFSRAPSEEEGRKYKDYEPDIPLRVFHIGPWLKQQQVFKHIMQAENQMEVYDIIRGLRGFAEFLAYQVFVDLTYIPDFPFSENEFVICGPGCKRGMDILFEDYDYLTHEEALFWLRDNIEDMCRFGYANGSMKNPYTPKALFNDRAPYDRKLNIMALENCFCEFQKYHRTFTGKSRPRVKYGTR